MIIIDLTEDWRIQSEPHAWALAKRKKCKPGVKTCQDGWLWQAQTWHRTLSAAGEYFAGQQMRHSSAAGAREAALRRDYWEAVVSKALRPLGPLNRKDASLDIHHER